MRDTSYNVQVFGFMSLVPWVHHLMVLFKAIFHKTVIVHLQQKDQPATLPAIIEVKYCKGQDYYRSVFLSQRFFSWTTHDYWHQVQGQLYLNESMNEFTYLNVDPESCSRSQCSGYGFNKCNTCSAPYCSSRCKSKDFRNHRRQCPNLKLEEQQRQQKEQQLESCIKRLREDIERLTDHGLCKICLEEESRVVFDPCGHLCFCHDCSEQLKKCPLCREDVQKPINVFT